MTSVQAIILAAGQGTRMKSSTPKVLLPICGRPMISYSIHLAAAMGAKQPIVVLGPDADAVKAVLPQDVQVVIQRKPLGTADAVLSARRALKEGAGHVLILYADVPLVRRATIQRLIETRAKAGATVTLLTAHLADPTGYGRIVRNEVGVVTGVVEEAEATSAQRAIREINVGPLVCQAPALKNALAEVKPSAATKEQYLTQVITLMARQEGAKVMTVRVTEASEAMGVNTRADLSRAIGIIRQRVIETHLRNGVSIEDPETAWIDHGVTIGADTVIRPATVIEAGVTIGRRCAVGPFARLRAGVTLADDVRVGSFVELVRTKVGARTKINHVSYLGDAVVEEDVNIGAGTITANYDGTRKSTTQIGRGAFIGSDTILIAPVKVGQGAVTGAGSVVPKAHDVPARKTVAGVPAKLLDGRAPEPPPAAAPVRVSARHPETPTRPATAEPRRTARPAARQTARRRPTAKRPAAKRARPAARRR